MSDTTETILDFLRAIGIGVEERALPPGTFLPGVRVVAGALVVDRATLRWPGDLLHEAGHIAVTPASQRSLLHDAIDDADTPHGGEMEATAWAYAAIVHLGLPSTVLFHEGGYRGQSAALAMTYDAGVHLGAHGLMQAGMAVCGVGVDAAAAYPRMQRWLRA